MPSPAQIEGRALVESMLPPGHPYPDVTVRARRDAGGEHIAFHFSPGNGHGHGGEWRETILLPREKGRHHEAALERIRHKIARDVEIACMLRDLRSEAELRLASDATHEIPTPAWRFHCPLPLRRAMDRAGLNDERRAALAVDKGSFDLEGYQIRINDRDEREAALGYRHVGYRTISRITITGNGVKFSQGINRCYLDVGGILPEMMRTALTGLPASMLVDIPGLDAPATVVERCSTSTLRNETSYDLSRTFSLMSDPPSMRRPA